MNNKHIGNLLIEAFGPLKELPTGMAWELQFDPEGASITNTEVAYPDLRTSEWFYVPPVQEHKTYKAPIMVALKQPDQPVLENPSIESEALTHPRDWRAKSTEELVKFMLGEDFVDQVWIYDKSGTGCSQATISICGGILRFFRVDGVSDTHEEMIEQGVRWSNTPLSTYADCFSFYAIETEQPEDENDRATDEQPEEPCDCFDCRLKKGDINPIIRNLVEYLNIEASTTKAEGLDS